MRSTYDICVRCGGRRAAHDAESPHDCPYTECDGFRESGRFLQLYCGNDMASADWRLQTVFIEREDLAAWHGRPLDEPTVQIAFHKSTWRIVS